MGNYLKLHRKMLNWGWYSDINTKVVFLHCLLKANYLPGEWHGVKYEVGEFITSLETLANETGLTISQVRTALNHLKLTGEIASKPQGKCRIITVNNWCEYQDDSKEGRKKVARKSQDNRKDVATDKEYKESKEGKELKNNIGLYFPDDENLNAAFKDFVDYRKSIKKPMGERAIELNKKDLEKLSAGDSSKAIAIINQSIKRGWQGLFPLKGDDNYGPSNTGNTRADEDYTAIDETIRRIESGEADHDDDGLWD